LFQLSRTWYLRSSRNDRLHFAHYRIREDLLCRTFGRYHAVLGDGVRKIRIQFEDYFDDRSSTCSFHWQHSRTYPETRQVDIFRRGKRIVVEMDFEVDFISPFISLTVGRRNFWLSGISFTVRLGKIRIESILPESGVHAIHLQQYPVSSRGIQSCGIKYSKIKRIYRFPFPILLFLLAY